MPSLLIIDDDNGTLQMLQILFERNGFDVLTTPEATVGLESIAQFGFDLAIIDLLLPGPITGLETITEAKNMAPRMPVIVLTAVASQSNRQNALAAGGDFFVEKPFHPKELVQTVNRLIGI